MDQKWNEWQTRILDQLDSTKGVMGQIVWMHQEYKRKDFMDIFRRIVARNDVIYTTRGVDDIRKLIKTYVVDATEVYSKQIKRTLIIDLPEYRELNLELFCLLNQIRMGAIDNDTDKPYTFDALDIIVFSGQSPDSDIIKRDNIDMIVINRLQEII